MAKARATKTPPPAVPAPRAGLREVDWLALGTAALCVLFGYASRNALNPDGVSYLDLAARLRAGDWSHVVQGYWSPLYPLLLAVGGAITGRDGQALLGVVHTINTLIALGGVAAVWWIARRLDRPAFQRAAFAMLLVCSARAPRLDAVTPDLLLLAIVVLLAGELLGFDGARPVRLGVWLGLAFLAKTSAWPWLLCVLVVRAALRRGPAAWRALGVTAATTAAIAALWIVPLSMKAGTPTLGSSGRLNACWYLLECDSRSPDTHNGTHAKYVQVPAGAQRATIAIFEGPWTWEPWGDPTAWAGGVGTFTQIHPTVTEHLRYWAKQLGIVLGLWLPHLLAIAAITLVLYRRRGMGRELVGDERAAGEAMLYGTLGVLQFVAVHVEPRLIAPFALLLGLGAVAWATGAGRAQAAPVPQPWFAILTWAGLVVAVPRAVDALREQWVSSAQVDQRMAAIAAADAQRPGGAGERRIAVIGQVFPLVTEAWRLRGQVVLQVVHPRVPELMQWPAADQQALVASLATQGVTEAWLSKPGGTFSILPLQPR